MLITQCKSYLLYLSDNLDDEIIEKIEDTLNDEGIDFTGTSRSNNCLEFDDNDDMEQAENLLMDLENELNETEE